VSNGCCNITSEVLGAFLAARFHAAADFCWLRPGAGQCGAFDEVGAGLKLGDFGRLQCEDASGCAASNHDAIFTHGIPPLWFFAWRIGALKRCGLVAYWDERCPISL
jgi:hypothetical protein